jgi:hypothetical protein
VVPARHRRILGEQPVSLPLTPPEKNLLGVILTDNRAIEFIPDGVTGELFLDARAGLIFDKAVAAIAAGHHVDSIWASNLVTDDPTILNVDPAEIWPLTDYIMYAPQAADYAIAVARDATRRSLANVTKAVASSLESGQDPVSVASDAVRWSQEVVDGTASTGRLQPKLLREILATPDDYDWVIPNLLERKDRLILTGSEGVGKTTFARQLVVCSAAGLHPLTFERMHPVRCLVIDAENTERQWRRYVGSLAFNAAEQGMVDPRDLLWIKAGQRLDLTSGADLAEIHRLIDRFEPDLLYIGPLYKLVPKAIYSDDDAAPLIVALDSLRDRDLALVMEAHAGKAKDHLGDRNLEPRGSSQLLGWPEFGFGLRVNRDDPAAVDVVRWRGDREANRMWPTRLLRGNVWPWVDGSPGGT